MSVILLSSLSYLLSLSFWASVLVVMLVFGFLILIHEFGHFIVAKWCGVKVEKFYIGFDFWGLKLCSFQWGETEYGIGVFPLGGYVKMLGQEDNPGELREEYEKSKLAIYKGADDMADVDALDEQREILHDPRSYLAKPVWQRMAIIVAGVTMNAIFAYVAGILAYQAGIEENPPEVTVVAGSPAWNNGLRSGDTIVSINGVQTSSFSKVQQNVALSGKKSESGLEVWINSIDTDKLEQLKIPTKSNGMNQVMGILPASSLNLLESMPGRPGSPAAAAFYNVKEKSMALPENTCIKAVDGISVKSYNDFAEYLRFHRDKPVKVTVGPNRSCKGSNDSAPKLKTKDVVIPPRPSLDLGLVMKIGKITGVRPNSPAHRAGIKAGDELLTLDGIPISDPWKFPQVIEQRVKKHQESGEEEPLSITLGVQRVRELRQGEKERDSVISDKFTLLDVKQTSDYSPILRQCSLAVPELGFCYEITNTISYVLPGSPADKAGIQPKMKITGFQILPPEYPADEKLAGVTKAQWDSYFEKFPKINLDEHHPDWAFVMDTIQNYPVGTKVRLFTDVMTYDVTPEESKDSFAADRGVTVYAKTAKIRAASFGESVSMGVEKTNEMFLLVFRMIHRLCTGEVSMKGLGGPVMLAQVAYQSANRGFGILMLFTCMISANLAVFNLLPIPVVDGGHVVFLTWEWIFGTPPPENLMVILSYIGLFILLALMIWTLLLDCGIISRYNM